MRSVSLRVNDNVVVRNCIEMAYVFDNAENISMVSTTNLVKIVWFVLCVMYLVVVRLLILE